MGLGSIQIGSGSVRIGSGSVQIGSGSVRIEKGSPRIKIVQLTVSFAWRGLTHIENFWNEKGELLKRERVLYKIKKKI
jgi:hypothetical protein